MFYEAARSAIGLRGHRGRQVRRPTAQSGRRSSAWGAALPALCLLCSGSLDSPYTEMGLWCMGWDFWWLLYTEMGFWCTE